MTDVLVVVETSAGQPRGAAWELLTPARELAAGGTVRALIVGSGIAAVAPEAFARGADRVLVVDSPPLDRYTADGYALAVEAAIHATRPRIVLLPGSTAGRDLGPYLAARANTSCLSDCVALRIDGPDLVGTRPIYGGKMLVDASLAADEIAFAVVRAGAYAAPEAISDATGGAIDALALHVGADDLRVTIDQVLPKGGGSVNLAAAERIVTGGRGVGSAENFAMIEDLAAALDASVGATRAVCDAGWRPHHEQIGQTGHNVKPKLYVAVGVSGAVQHLAGMRGSDTIVAINRDADAPIFRQAALGIVGDAAEVVPALTQAIRAARASNA